MKNVITKLQKSKSLFLSLEKIGRRGQLISITILQKKIIIKENLLKKNLKRKETAIIKYESGPRRN